MDIVKLLPENLGIDVLLFLYPIIDQIHFNKLNLENIYNSNYSTKYDVAHNKKNKKITNSNKFLSRISKKNGLHRYYITRTCQGCGSSSCKSKFCRGSFDYDHYYKSKYVGKCLISSLIILLSNSLKYSSNLFLKFPILALLPS